MSSLAKTTSISVVFLLLLSASEAHAGLRKWLKKEVVPTLTGERPLHLKPEISISHGEKLRIQISPNSAYINVGGVTVKTQKLQLRLQQAGCIVETGGNVLQCAPDIVKREVDKLLREPQEPLAAAQPQAPGAPPQQPNAGTLRPLGWVPGWQPQIAFKCVMADGAVLGLSVDGYIHVETPQGLTNPVGVVKPSAYPQFRYFLSDGRGLEMPVDQLGQVLQSDGLRYHVVGNCGSF
ncbi:MAG: hypothetical protein H0T76_24015 [Nannocystis sp.]|nr:hypothetical protein [Nannocystis sp.]MBA3549554.1 hypothetical protein [Nannocystis sp.]